MAKEVGFDCSKECFIKGDQSVIIMNEIEKDFTLVIFFEMNQLKVEFFDCENYITTIDDLVVNLVESLNYDKEDSENQEN